MDEIVRDSWFGIRCFFLHSGGLYEERIVVVQAETAERAIERGELEADAYAEGLAIERIESVQSFWMFDEPADMREVFSLLRQSDLPADAYVDRYFDTGTERQRTVE
jgi:hypothetical protein